MQFRRCLCTAFDSHHRHSGLACCLLCYEVSIERPIAHQTLALSMYLVADRVKFELAHDATAVWRGACVLCCVSYSLIGGKNTSSWQLGCTTN
jgi:hypothetical protein